MRSTMFPTKSIMEKSTERTSCIFRHREEVQTLDILCEDKILGLQVVLSYSVFEKENVITRSVKLINKGIRSLKLRKSTVHVWIWITRTLRC